MKLRNLAAVFACAFVAVAASLYAEDKKKDPLEGVMCPVSNKQVKAESSAEYKGAKVYFCCDGCPGAFAKDTAKFATKANAQLVASHQAEQVKCPLSGGPVKAGTEVKVAGSSVGFCCNNCKGKVEKAEGDAQAELVFADAAFAKGFKVSEAKK